MKDPRQNKNISTDQVIALSCEIAGEELHSVWDTHYSEMNMDRLDENGEPMGEYSDKAQEVFKCSLKNIISVSFLFEVISALSDFVSSWSSCVCKNSNSSLS